MSLNNKVISIGSLILIMLCAIAGSTASALNDATKNDSSDFQCHSQFDEMVENASVGEAGGRQYSVTWYSNGITNHLCFFRKESGHEIFVGSILVSKDTSETFVFGTCAENGAPSDATFALSKLAKDSGPVEIVKAWRFDYVEESAVQISAQSVRCFDF